ncbi:double-strand break repair helicase AddA [Stappia sp. P2PMeth1]|uniref:double-strand break repair helicase AddA n=1 Tax=Stappia sp. P2PMeth1 TaxID=2003586 RepID=UPI001648F150|nr:double-strand break repair helicase AddA [Stappia sp. P2PMeth1]
MSTFEIPLATREKQARAADPLRSAWVSANAGSGKTFVLARRVIRLLLAGTAPSRILCLTFTKAAASEMATRVFETLGSWIALTDEALAKELEVIEGRRPDARGLARARHLFAVALETPGGLKIQTIHAFCEAILHQFPLEANVAGHFQVLDDRQAADLLAGARSRVLALAEREPESRLGRALVHLVSELPDKTVEAALADLIARRDTLRRWLQDAGSLEAALAQLAEAFGLSEGETLAALDAALCEEVSISPQEALAYAEALASGGARDIERAERLRMAARLAGTPDAWWEVWHRVFLNKDLAPTKSLAGKKVEENFPQVVERLYAEQERLLALLERRRIAYALAGTEAALRLADAMLDIYEGEKTRRGLMDFEDLIVRTASLLSRADAALWVQYKLDQGLDHILVDEAQDTSPHQWRVVQALAEEFFAGASANPRTRTLFAVGDEKQSIYSFQGAVPAYFADMRRYFERRAKEAEAAFERVELTLSFRSRPDVLSAVDTVFAEADMHSGLSREAGAPVHEAVRRNDPGMVEIWPPEEPVAQEVPDDWTAPVDRIGAGSPMLRLADRLARSVRGWWKSGEAAPGDVLVLVRKRGPFVDALTRALKREGVPVAGSDRLVLNDHIAVEDLLALGRFLLLPEDDLSLACLLKSPLIGLDDEALFRLARPDGANLRSGTLWQSLRRQAEGDPAFERARERIETWRARADFLPPFEFFSRLIGADGGRRAFRARLGSEVDDVLDEFLAVTLAFEQTGVPGLEGFLAWFAAAPTEVKRELNAARGVVRIMTVHGAKGLEAPLVVLVDGGAAPVSAHHDPVFIERTLPGTLGEVTGLVWNPVKAERSPWHGERLDALRQAAADEYRRLLYVAMTRARDRLVVCGWMPARGQSDECWHALVARALEPGARDGETGDGGACRIWQRPGTTAPAPLLARAGEAAAEEAGLPPPAWLFAPVTAIERPRRLRPSEAFDEMEAKEGTEPVAATDRLAEARAAPDFALERGRHLHRLLQLLPDLPQAERRAAGARYLAHALTPVFAPRGEQLLSEALGVLEHPGFAAVFSGDARAEVPLAGTLRLADGSAYEVSGQIDRLRVDKDAVWILDFKTDRRVPEGPQEIAEAYLVQLAVYRRLVADIWPGRAVRAALVYTAGPKLVELPAEAMDAAVAALAPA